MQKKLTLVVHDIYRDGGTMLCYELKKPTKPYYIDNRMRSKTYGKLFDKYPGDQDAQVLDIEYKIYSPLRLYVDK